MQANEESQNENGSAAGLEFDEEDAGDKEEEEEDEEDNEEAGASSHSHRAHDGRARIDDGTSISEVVIRSGLYSKTIDDVRAENIARINQELKRYGLLPPTPPPKKKKEKKVLLAL